MENLLRHLAVVALASTVLSGSQAASSLTNPVIYEDLADLDVIRVGSTFYYTASTMHYSPGAPILRSYDLASWEFVGHAVPELAWGDKYYLPDPSNEDLRAYDAGIWASTMQYRASTDTFHWMGCVDFSGTHILTSSGGNGDPTAAAWVEQPVISTCYYDCGLLVDDDDSMYVAYGSTNINVAKLTSDGLAEESTQVVFNSTDGVYIEGSRFYKVNGTYYIFVTRPSDAEYVLKSDNVWGPYEEKVLVDAIILSPLNDIDGVGESGSPHQGGLVDTEDGTYYYTAFVDAYPGGRIPVIAPLTWDENGWPAVVTDESGGWASEYPIPAQTDQTVAPLTYTDDFSGDTLSPHWEWNHNPNNSMWSLSQDGLVLKTATITDDLYSAQNTLTQRTLGPFSSGTFQLDISNMANGDRAGAVLLRDHSGYVGIWKDNDIASIVMVDGLRINSTDTTWQTTSTGTVDETGPSVDNTTDVWFRIAVDNRPVPASSTTRNATFAYSVDGTNFVRIGPTFAMESTWEFFPGPRYSVFNYATEALGGEVLVKGFVLQQEDQLLHA